MSTDLAKPAETLDQHAEQITIAAVTAAIRCGFDPSGTRGINLKQTVDACAIIVTFLREAEKGPQRTIAEWRAAVENLSVTVGS